MPIYSPTGFLDVTNATLRTSNIEAENFKLNGGNIYVSTDFTVAPTLQLITNGGSVTSNTVQFSNVTTGLVADSNIVVTGNVTAGYLHGDASNVTAVPAAQVTGTLVVANGGTGTTTGTGTGSVVLSDAPTFTGDVTFDTDTLFVDSVNNRVGVGTTSPDKLLEISGASGLDNLSPVHFRITNTQSATNGNPFTDITKPSGLISFYTPDTSTAGPGDVAGIGFRPESTLGGDTALCFYTNSENDDAGTPLQERMCITHDGNVGIGRTDPQVLLDVAGSANNGKSLQLRSGDELSGTDSSQIIFSYNGFSYNNGGYAHSIRTRHNSGGDSGNAIDFWLWNTTDTTDENTLGNKRVMTIEGTGRVGIGVTNPATTLEVKFPSNDGSQPILSLIRDGTMSSTVGATFRAIDIKTQQTGYSPVTHASINLVNYNPSGSGQFGLSQPGRQDTGFGFSVIHDGSTVENALVISSIGNVGIGKTDPSQKLDVNGVIKSNVPSWNMWDVGTIASGILNFSTNYLTPQNCTVTLSTGRVTITVAGRYFMSFHGFTEDDVAPGTGCQYYIRKNGSGVVRNYHTQPDRPGTLDYIYGAMGGITVIMDLAVNDYVDVSTNFAVHSANGAGFCGFMIG